MRSPGWRLVVFYVPEQAEAGLQSVALLRHLQAARGCIAVSPAVFATLAETLTPQGSQQ